MNGLFPTNVRNLEDHVLYSWLFSSYNRLRSEEHTWLIIGVCGLRCHDDNSLKAKQTNKRLCDLLSNPWATVWLDWSHPRNWSNLCCFPSPGVSFPGCFQGFHPSIWMSKATCNTCACRGLYFIVFFLISIFICCFFWVINIFLMYYLSVTIMCYVLSSSHRQLPLVLGLLEKGIREREAETNRQGWEWWGGESLRYLWPLMALRPYQSLH